MNCLRVGLEQRSDVELASETASWCLARAEWRRGERRRRDSNPLHKLFFLTFLNKKAIFFVGVLVKSKVRERKEDEDIWTVWCIRKVFFLRLLLLGCKD